MVLKPGLTTVQYIGFTTGDQERDGDWPNLNEWPTGTPYYSFSRYERRKEGVN